MSFRRAGQIRTLTTIRWRSAKARHEKFLITLTVNNNFVNFITECESDFTITSPNLTGRIAEYANTSNQPIIVTSDNQQQVMVVMIGTNDGDLLTYWKQMQWVVTGS